MEQLHRQVLPFILRRVKEDVLSDLPPKITQDLLCELSPLQHRLYEDFSRSHLKSDDLNALSNMGRSSGKGDDIKKSHIFQALRYLQNVCNHPKLVLNKHHPEFVNILGEMAKVNKSLDDIEHAAKLPALKLVLPILHHSWQCLIEIFFLTDNYCKIVALALKHRTANRCQPSISIVHSSSVN